jgi:hypothetical protein
VRYGQTLVLVLMAAAPFAAAGNDARDRLTTPAPLAIPHATQLDLDFQSRRRARAGGRFESSDLPYLTPGLHPLAFPRNNDMRARILTPELKRAPLVGWIATNLYRSKRENGWCLEVDPGEGEYLVFYRLHLK